jgi:hypothetical protein
MGPARRTMTAMSGQLDLPGAVGASRWGHIWVTPRLRSPSDHHAFLLAQMLQRIDGVTADIATAQERIEAQLGELAPAVARLDAIPGIGPIAAQMILAEVGSDMGRCPTPAHLTSWARFAPGVSGSAGRKKGNAGTGNGNRYLARVVGEAAVSAGRTDTFLGKRYRRIARRRGKKRAIVAVGRSIRVIIWALLSDTEAQFVDLGADYYAQPDQPGTPSPPPHPRAPGTRLHRHPQPGSLTGAPGIFGIRRLLVNRPWCSVPASKSVVGYSLVSASHPKPGVRRPARGTSRSALRRMPGSCCPPL